MSGTDEPDPRSSATEAIELARDACGRHEWAEAFRILRAADESGELSAEGLELMADCARWAGRTDDLLEPLERAHRTYVRGGDSRSAARTALALCYSHGDVCQDAVAASWWQRADELLADLEDGPEHGLHAWFQGRSLGDSGDLDGHEEHARRALDLARRYGDRNVEALALLDVAHVSSARGHGEEAMQALERATALALGGEIGVLESGIVFCNAIWASRCRGEWQRAGEWCESANRWVQRVQVAYFPGLCRVHRSEVLRMRGALEEAETEAHDAVRLLEEGIPRWVSAALTELGEVRRRRGDLSGAMTAFRRALELGWDPEPGLALLLLAQGDPESAHRTIERAMHRPPTLLCEDRSNLLVARTVVAIAAGRLETARTAADELEAMTGRNDTPWDRAASAMTRGLVLMADGHAREAVESLTRSRAAWAELDAPFEFATCCAALARALRADGDRAGADMEFEVARGIFDRIGAHHERDVVAAERSGLAGEPTTGDRSNATDSDTLEATFLREGDYWSVGFGDAVLRLRDGRGPRYLARLLSRPDEDCWAVDLAAGVAVGPTARGDAGEVIDAEARTAYRRRLADLQEDLAEAEEHNDLARAEGLRGERDELVRQLAQAVGLGGRARRAGDPVERARQSVTKAIRSALKKLAAEHEGLGRYLENTVRTGTACRFEPDPGQPVAWHVRGSD